MPVVNAEALMLIITTTKMAIWLAVAMIVFLQKGIWMIDIILFFMLAIGVCGIMVMIYRASDRWYWKQYKKMRQKHDWGDKNDSRG